MRSRAAACLMVTIFECSCEHGTPAQVANVDDDYTGSACKDCSEGYILEHGDCVLVPPVTTPPAPNTQAPSFPTWTCGDKFGTQDGNARVAATDRPLLYSSM